jgi:ADP-ribosyl-[dinitrogen reductase] hydrolase
MTAKDAKDRFRGCLLGLACGDAVGAPLEGLTRGAFPPVTTMTGGGTWGVSPGEWTDDTSMALCLAHSLLESNGFDAENQMDKYTAWMDKGYMSSRGVCFGVGATCAASLEYYKNTGDPLSGPVDPETAGNGCIMRLAPVPMYYYPHADRAVFYSGESSRTTHGARECIDACRLFGSMLLAALGGAGRDETLFDNSFRNAPSGTLSKTIHFLAQGVYRHKRESEIRGTAYVVESLEAGLWAFFNSRSYEEAILNAVNLGDDADTTAAVCGQLAGAYYGGSNIPGEWLGRLVMAGEIGELADKLFEAHTEEHPTSKDGSST